MVVLSACSRATTGRASPRRRSFMRRWASARGRTSRRLGYSRRRRSGPASAREPARPSRYTHLVRLRAPGRRLPANMVKAGQLAVRFSLAAPRRPASDLYMHSGAKSGWHGVGQRIAYFYVWLNKPFRHRPRTASSDRPARAIRRWFMNLLGDCAGRRGGSPKASAYVARAPEARRWEGAHRHPFAAPLQPVHPYHERGGDAQSPRHGPPRPPPRRATPPPPRVHGGPSCRLLVRFVSSPTRRRSTCSSRTKRPPRGVSAPPRPQCLACERHLPHGCGRRSRGGRGPRGPRPRGAEPFGWWMPP